MTKPPATPWAYLRRARIKANLTQTALAEKAGCSVPTISMLESGYRGCRPDLYHRLAAALGIKVDDLIDNPPTPAPQVSARSAVAS